MKPNPYKFIDPSEYKAKEKRKDHEPYENHNERYGSPQCKREATNFCGV